MFRTEAERQLAGLMRQHNENLKEDEVYRDNVVQQPNKWVTLFVTVIVVFVVAIRSVYHIKIKRGLTFKTF